VLRFRRAPGKSILILFLYGDKAMRDTVQQKVSNCALCQKQALLVDSHVLPAFVFRWLKDTSATGFLRFAENPAKRVQDGIKFPWLCEDCERLLNGFETPFATKLFHPYNADTKVRVPYQEWLLKFCVSVSWRVLKHVEQKTGLKNLNDGHRVEVPRALERWRAFLFDEVSNPGPYEQHLLPLGPIESTNLTDLPDTMNRYLMRGVEMDVCGGEVSAHTFAKMGRFALFGTIKPTSKRWEGTRVAVRSGVIEPSRYGFPIGIVDYLKERARRYGQYLDSIPEHQQDRIEVTAMKNIERFRNSDLLQAMLNDERMFGTKAILRNPKR
jgi:hypothetical protein